jgi:hypothetical protein
LLADAVHEVIDGLYMMAGGEQMLAQNTAEVAEAARD